MFLFFIWKKMRIFAKVLEIVQTYLRENMPNKRLTPGYIFESSWEVCNKVGGIYTVGRRRSHHAGKAAADGKRDRHLRKDRRGDGKQPLHRPRGGACGYAL